MTAITPMSTALNAELSTTPESKAANAGGEQLVRLLATHLACDRHGTAEGFVGVVGESLIQAVRYNHICAVDGGEHATTMTVPSTVPVS